MAVRLGLLPRVVLALVAVAAIPLGLAVVQLIGINRSGMTTQVLRTHSVAARATAERIAAIVTGLQTPALALAGNPALAGGGDTSVMQSLLVGLLQARADVIGAVVLNSDGGEVVRVQRRDTSEAVTAAMQLLPSAEPCVIDDAYGPRLALSVALDGELGSLCVIASATGLLELLSPAELGEQAQIVVVDDQGRPLIALTSADRRGFSDELINAAISGKVVGSGRFEGEDGDYLGAFAAVPNSSWMVLSRQPVEVAEEAAQRMWRRAAIAVAVAVLVAAVVALAAYRSLVRPLREVAEAQRRLAGLPEATGRGTEIETLRKSFAVLERRVNDRDELGKVFLGRYQVVELVGEGAMGSVFRAWDPKLQREVALKTIRLGSSNLVFEKEGLATNLLREAVFIARFSHPHIVGVFDLEDTPEAAFLAMEFVDGVTLDDIRFQDGPLSPCQTALVGMAIAEALTAAHEKGMVHHDIKPGNVLLGYDGAIKVSDFGIANYASAAVKNDGKVVGTPGYLPPETLVGKGYDRSGDLFALGVVLYECLAGRRPFAGGSMSVMLRNTIRGKMTPLRDYRPDAPPELGQLIAELLATDRELRPQDAQGVAQQLRSYVNNHGCAWKPPARDNERSPSDGAGHGTLQVVPTTRLP